MNQRILVASAACAVVAALLGGCGSGASGKGGTGMTSTGGSSTPGEHAIAGMALARRVLKLSESQNITEARQAQTGGSYTSVLVTVRNREIRESFGPDGQPTMVQLGSRAYLRSGYQLATVKGKPDVRINKPCYAALGAVPGISGTIVPAGAKIYRVAGKTVYFENTAAGAKHGTGTQTKNRIGVQMFGARGYFRFNSDNLVTSEIIDTAIRPGTKVRTTVTFRYPKTTPKTLMTKPPKNICKR